MINCFETLCYTGCISYGNLHVIDEGTIIDEELVYIIGYIPCRIRHRHIYFYRFSISHLHKNIVVESHQLISGVMCQIGISK